MNPGTIDYRNWLSLREVDAAAGTRKGAAFRCFRQLAEKLQEGRDYVVLHAERDRETIRALRSGSRIYDSSVNVVLLSAASAARVTEALRKQIS